MKIEKINDNQIRCTLTRQDLADREITAQKKQSCCFVI